MWNFCSASRGGEQRIALIFLKVTSGKALYVVVSSSTSNLFPNIAGEIIKALLSARTFFSALLTFITFKCLRKRTRCVDIHLKAFFLYRIQGKASLQKLLEFEESPRLSEPKWTFFRRNFSVFFAGVNQDIKLCFNIEGFFLESKSTERQGSESDSFQASPFLRKPPMGWIA